MQLKKWFCGVSLILLALTGCNEDLMDTGSGLDMASSSITTLLADGISVDVCGIQTLDLTAGQTYVVGKVEVSNDETNLYVTYRYLPSGIYPSGVVDPWFGNLHLWVGTDLATLPRSGDGAPINGQFPYTFNGEESHNNGSASYTEYTFTIPLVNIPNFSKCGDVIYFVAHAETHCDLNGDGDQNDEGETETAYAGSRPGTETSRWFFYDEFMTKCCGTVVCGKLETAFAHGTHVFITPIYDRKTGAIDYKNNPEKFPFLSLTKNRWGWAINQPITEIDFVSPVTRWKITVWISCGWRCGYSQEVGYADIWYDKDNFYVKMVLYDNYNFANSWTQRWLMIQLNGVNAYLYPAQIQSLKLEEAGNPVREYTASLPLSSIPNWYGLGSPVFIRNEVGTNIGPGTFVNPLSNYYTDQFVNTIVPPVSIGEVEYPVYAGAGLNNITNGTLVGKAIVSYDGTTLNVRYELDEGYEMEEVHIYANDALPVKVAPGQFGFSEYFDPMVNNFETEFDVPDINGDGKIWLILHAVVNIAY